MGDGAGRSAAPSSGSTALSWAAGRCDDGVGLWAATATDTTQREVRTARLQAATCVMHMTKYDPACRDSVRENEYMAALLAVMKVRAPPTLT